MNESPPSSSSSIGASRKKVRASRGAAVSTAVESNAFIPPLRLDHPRETSYLGISQSLIFTLVEVYFEKAHNASLLLHKGLFLESLRSGKANPHVVLSVCAWAANFYRDDHGEPSLKNHGFMIEWAKRAGKLVFADAEDLCDDNIVTFSILALFWYSQGSWRLCYLHKGNAYGLLHIRGLGSAKLHTQNSLESEIRRRRLWACYLAHCTLGENLSLFEPVADITRLPLPWPEADFEAGVSRGAPVCLASGGSGGGIYAEMVKAMTLWATVFSLIKCPETSISERMTGIYALDDDLKIWWRSLRSNWKLTPSTIGSIPADRLTNILLLNVIYHQSLSALHASVVPLFSWSAGDTNWSSARQASAQVAFEHASAASALIEATIATGQSVLHTFIAYAAYSGCAIQIPFMWCLNPAIKARAIANVKANTKMIRTMSQYWKFASLLEIHVGCLYNIHKSHAPILEDEPKNVDIQKLIDFKIDAAYARTSILGFVAILRNRGDGVADRGDENKDLGIQDSSIQSPGQAQRQENSRDEDGLTAIAPELVTEGGLYTLLHTNSNSAQTRSQNTSIPESSAHQQSPPHRMIQDHGQESQPEHADQLYPIVDDNDFTEHVFEQQESLDVCRPFFDPTMLDLFPDGEMPDLSHFETSLSSLDYFELDDWNMSTSLMDQSSDH
ncbi:hypothetical protein LTR84_008003 [Exophiala bonariae]|uniref:Xylanolytic transcriptional activator regulatory domain-containing protein n=1 Tax=Exophiala bonariae TaxID=1690606 RepID=A0AAV9NQF9_9EURO|nr:hypothetical protein LTR84_008003 [Exophiala bonariae]